MSLATVHFTRTTFEELLRDESLRCIRVAVERGWLPLVPDASVFYFPAIDHRFLVNKDDLFVTVPQTALLTGEELLPHLFREEDGYFRSAIVLAPFALTAKETVIEVSLRDPDWTNQIITGKYAFPHEPFQLHGPAIPVGWREGEPYPMVSLPRLLTASTFC
jgi:hypothetical protein